AGLYTKQLLPGVGASLGLDRLFAAMERLGQLPGGLPSAPVFIVQVNSKYLALYFCKDGRVRAAGRGALVFSGANTHTTQTQYAERNDFRVALIAGPDEFAQGTWKIKNLAQRAETVVAETEVMARLGAMLSRRPAS